MLTWQQSLLTVVEFHAITNMPTLVAKARAIKTQRHAQIVQFTVQTSSQITDIPIIR